MNESSKTYWTDDPDQVEKYVLGQLSQEERDRMDREITDCEPCKQKLRLEMDIAAGIKRHGRETLKVNLRSRLRMDGSRSLQRYSYAGLAAAVVIIGVGLGLYKIWFNDLTAPEHFGKKEIVIHPSAPLHDSLAVGNMTAPSQAQSSASGGGNQPASEEAITQEEGNQPAAKKTQDFADQGVSKQRSAETKAKKNIPQASARPAKVNEVHVKPFSQKVWLIGTIVMVANSKTESTPSLMAEKRLDEMSTEQSLKKDFDRTKTFSFTAKGRDQQVVLEQRALYELPPSRQTELAATKHIETLVEHNEKGLNLVMFNDEITANDLKNASVEITPPDSLIVTMKDQKIIYRLPKSWDIQERTLTR